MRGEELEKTAEGGQVSNTKKHNKGIFACLILLFLISSVVNLIQNQNFAEIKKVGINYIKDN